MFQPFYHRQGTILYGSGIHWQLESPTCEAGGFSSSQKMSRILWNPNVPLPLSQALANSLYPKPDESKSSHPFYIRVLECFI
jgi:hypothetical protein